MAEGFIGLSVLAALRHPYKAKVRGLVTNIVAGELTLSKVTWLSNGSRTERLVVPGSNVLEIEIEADLVPSPSPNKDAPVKEKSKEDFADPAIVSFGRPSISNDLVPSIPQAKKESDQISDINIPRPVLPTPTAPQAPQPSIKLPQENRPDESGIIDSVDPKNIPASATLTGPFNDFTLNGHEAPVSNHEAQDVDTQGPLVSLNARNFSGTPAIRARGKRGGKKIGPKGEMVSTPTQTPSDLEFASIPFSAQKRGNSNKKGWRQTPMLEDTNTASLRPPDAPNGLTPPNPRLTPGPAARRSKRTPEPTKNRRRRYREEEDQNGWATGEATDIQDMGDFDFEENHKKFDKRKVFDEIRRDDTTADESRLVSFNRLPSARAGTAGGKNLHYTENVLDSPVNKSVEHSSGDSDLEISEARISSGRSLSRASTHRKVPSRKGSAMAKTSFDRIPSPKIKSESSFSNRKTSIQSAKPTLIITSSKTTCPCISPLQMLELEQLATTELDLTEDMVTENAARSIAQAAHTLGSSANDPHQTSSSPLIVILAGNNKTSSRAIAAGRHLRNHGARIVLCILGLEREDDLIDSVRRHLNIYRKCGGQAIKQDALMRTLRKLKSPVDLIVDALLGIHISFDDLRSDDQAAYFQLVCWANSNEADILALDVPSGIDASTGLATYHDSTELVLTAQHVFSLGAPKTGLLTFLAEMEPSARPSLAVADIGISAVAWKKFGTRRRHGIDFGGEWVVGVEVRDGGRG